MRAQKGMSAMGLLFLLILGGFVVLCLLKIGPLYYNNYKMDAIFVRIGSETPIERQTDEEIRKRLSAQFSVDGIRGVSPRDVEIERDRSGEVTLIYAHEDRVNLLGNLDVIVVFENRYSTAEEEAEE